MSQQHKHTLNTAGAVLVVTALPVVEQTITSTTCSFWLTTLLRYRTRYTRYDISWFNRTPPPKRLLLRQRHRQKRSSPTKPQQKGGRARVNSLASRAWRVLHHVLTSTTYARTLKYHNTPHILQKLERHRKNRFKNKGGSTPEFQKLRRPVRRVGAAVNHLLYHYIYQHILNTR